MSAPPVKTSALLRWLSVLMVVAAVVARFWPTGTPSPNSAAPATRSASVATPSAAPPYVVPAPPVTAPAAGARAFGEAVGFRSHERFVDHFRKHGGEFRVATPEKYLRLAQSLRDRPVGGDVLELVRGDGVVCRFDRASGAFIAFGGDGIIRTFFRPSDGERYFERQATRPQRMP